MYLLQVLKTCTGGNVKNRPLAEDTCYDWYRLLNQSYSQICEKKTAVDAKEKIMKQN